MFLSMVGIRPGPVNISSIGKYENDILLGHLKLDNKAQTRGFQFQLTTRASQRDSDFIGLEQDWGTVFLKAHSNMYPELKTTDLKEQG